MSAFKKTLPYKFLQSIHMGWKILHTPSYYEGRNKSLAEKEKSPSRTDIINYLIQYLDRECSYLEIGVRNPEDNFDKIAAHTKYSVDPGVEYEDNPVDFKMTSDAFFTKLSQGDVLDPDVRFDIIFIDGLHLADQVHRDIEHALRYISEDGFIVLHDCNPPTQWHAREDYYYPHTPAQRYWNGTTWKAFLHWRLSMASTSCCIDTDWGVGIISHRHPIGRTTDLTNPYYEYEVLADHREELLGLLSYAEFKARLAS